MKPVANSAVLLFSNNLIKGAPNLFFYFLKLNFILNFNL